MKQMFAFIAAISLFSGCAHNDHGGVDDRSYEERGAAYGRPGVQSQMQRDFPGRVGPGMDRPLDPALPR